MEKNSLLLKLIISLIAVAATISLIQLWVPFLSTSLFIKILVTFGITSIVSGLIIALEADTYNAKKLRDHSLSKVIITLIVAVATLVIAQMWLPFISTNIFVKILITFGVVIFVLSLIIAIKSDLGSEKKLKDQNYLD